MPLAKHLIFLFRQTQVAASMQKDKKRMRDTPDAYLWFSTLLDMVLFVDVVLLKTTLTTWHQFEERLL